MKDIKIGIIGLGYVGLPLAIEFAKYFKTVGFDINKNRISELNLGKDSTGEVANQRSTGIFKSSFNLRRKTY